MKTLFLAALLIDLALPFSSRAALTDLVLAANNFSATIRQQLESVKSDPSPAEMAEATISYSEAKADYYKVLAASIPELTAIAKGKEAKPPELDQFGQAFELAGENQEKEADQETSNLLKKFADNPDVGKAATDFAAAQKIEETFIQEFSGLDFGSQFGGLRFPGS